MTNDEKEMFRSAVHFLKKFEGFEGTDEYWLAAAKEVGKVCWQWHNHTLIKGLISAVYRYMEERCKEHGQGT